MPTGWMGGWQADSTWLGWAGSRLVSIGHARPGLTTLAIGLAVLAVVEAGYIYYLRRRTDGGGRLEKRVDQLTEALKLLTDTTESGLTALAVEVQRAQLRAETPRAKSRGQAGPRASGTKAKSPRVAAEATEKSLSLDAVELHAALAAVGANENPVTRTAVRSELPTS